jgi:hypothetical protein
MTLWRVGIVEGMKKDKEGCEEGTPALQEEGD